MKKTLINLNMIEWARNRGGYTRQDFIKKLSISDEKYHKILNGEISLSKTMIEKISKLAFVDNSYLYLSDDNAPNIEFNSIINEIMVDFRTIGDRPKQNISVNLFDCINEVNYYQQYYRERLIEHGANINQLNKQFKLNDSLDLIITEIKKRYNFKHSAKLTENIKLFEDLGILVLRIGYTHGAHSKRKLDINEFRGLAFHDEYAPLIVLNKNDSDEAQNFTLFHEFCHILLGDNALCPTGLDINIDEYNDNKKNTITEKFCNEFAAEFLLPAEELQKIWHDHKNDFKNIANKFNISQLVVVRRCYEMGFINWNIYKNYYDEYYLNFYAKKAERKIIGGIKPEILERARLGNLLFSAIESDYHSNKLNRVDINNNFHFNGYGIFENNNHLTLEFISEFWQNFDQEYKNNIGLAHG